jgi:hypothetical protein
MTLPDDGLRMGLVDSLPNRPIRKSEYEAIEEAGGFEAVKPVTFAYGEDFVPFEDSKQAAVDLVVIADEWYAGLEFNPPGWTVIFREERLAESGVMEVYDQAARKLHDS